MWPPQKQPPTRRSTLDGWEVVEHKFETGGHTEARSPQRKSVNISSGQIANASSNGNDTLPAPCQGTMSSGTGPSSSIAAVAHKPESNDSSTETAGTDDAVTLPNPTGAPAAVVSATYPATATTSLTPSNMDTLQRELAQRYNDNIARWVDGSGTGARLLPPPSSSAAASHSDDTFATAGSMRSAAVTGAHHDWLLVPRPIPVVDDRLAAAGAWCDDSIGPFRSA